MSNKKLQTIKFPGLNDTYTIPQTYDDVGAASAAHTHTYSDVGALSASTTYVSTVNGQSGAVTIPDASAYIITYGGTVTYSEVVAAYNANRPIYVKYIDPDEGDLLYYPVIDLYSEGNYQQIDCGQNVWIRTEGGPQVVGQNYILWNTTTGWFINTESIQIPTAQVNSDWNAASGVSSILNKPTIPNVPSWALASTKPTYTYTEVGAASAGHTHSEYATESYVNTAISSAGFVEDFPITVTQLNDTYTADKTVAEIAAAAEAGSNIYVIFQGIIFPLMNGDAVTTNQYKLYLFGFTQFTQGYINSAIFNISNDGTSDSITFEYAFDNLGGALFIPYGTTPDFDISETAGTTPIYCEYIDTDLGHLYLPLIKGSSPYEFGKTLTYLNGHASYYGVTAYYSGNNLVWGTPYIADLESSSSESDIFVINMESRANSDGNGYSYTKDKTFAEIIAAYNAGKLCILIESIYANASATTPMYINVYSNMRTVFLSNSPSSVYFTRPTFGEHSVSGIQIRIKSNEGIVKTEGSVNILDTYNPASSYAMSGIAVASALSSLAIPSAVSELTNDAGYLTLATLPIYDGSVS